VPDESKKTSAKKKSASKAKAKAATKKSSAKGSTKPAEKTTAKKSASEGSSGKKTGASKKAVAKKTASSKSSGNTTAKPAAKKTAAKKTAKKATGAAKKASKPANTKDAVKKASSKKTAAKKASAKVAAAIKITESSDVEQDDEYDSGEVASPGTQPAVVPYERGSGHYMDVQQLQHFSQKLADWKQQLMEEVDRTVGHMKDDATNFPDPNDRATQEEEFSLELRTRDRERKLIKKINEAQKRIDDDEYGYCETCGIEIGVNRLEARPTAELCIDCKTLEEIRERQTA